LRTVSFSREPEISCCSPPCSRSLCRTPRREARKHARELKLLFEKLHAAITAGDDKTALALTNPLIPTKRH